LVHSSTNKIAGTAVAPTPAADIDFDSNLGKQRRTVRELLRKAAAGQIKLEQLPGYIPELNPDEGKWKRLKSM
jgi:hypothetical protein